MAKRANQFLETSFGPAPSLNSPYFTVCASRWMPKPMPGWSDGPAPDR